MSSDVVSLPAPRSFASTAWTVATTAAVTVAAVLAVCFLAGLDAGASAANSDSIFLQSPIEQAQAVDQMLLSRPPVTLGDQLLAAVWPVIEEPLVTGMLLGMQSPVAAKATVAAVWVLVVIVGGYHIVTTLREVDDDE